MQIFSPNAVLNPGLWFLLYYKTKILKFCKTKILKFKAKPIICNHLVTTDTNTNCKNTNQYRLFIVSAKL